MANETIFRDKSIERISSPDELSDYIRLSNPGMWLVLGAVALILTGAVVFGAVGHVDSTVEVVGISRGGEMICLIKKEYGARLSEDMTVRVDGEVYPAALLSASPVTVQQGTDAYALTVGGLKPGEWVYEVLVDGTFADGAYEVKLITAQIRPLSFLFGSR